MSEQPATQTDPNSSPPDQRPAGESEGPSLSDTVLQDVVALGSSAEAPSPSTPSHIGRYRVCRRLGGGGFGIVYLAHDDEIDRPVAIKVPRPDRLTSSEAVAAFLAEARHVARLKHPNIVTLYDFGQADGFCFLVSEYIDGVNLAERIQRGPISHRESALLVAQVADALHYAHGRHEEDRKEVYHRDVKLANILIDKRERPHLTDFGLAVSQEDLPKQRGRRPGTHPYMSPEQVRGEGHRIDGRTDIYSLGVVLYELLCGRRPFEGDSKEDVFDHILHTDPRPPRQVNDTIPTELERICLKALAKQMSARYTTAKDMADDLRAAVAPQAATSTTGAVQPVPAPPSSQATLDRPARVLPKGLRSFGPEDSDFFLQLLPGPRDRDGLPDSIRFWKTRIENRDQDRTFAVGLIYGPSGCGKSSLVRSGLLPRLAQGVVPVYLEASRDDTEVRLVKAIHKSCPNLRDIDQPTELTAELRRGRGLADGQKLLIVLDQFEQWLHSHGQQMDRSELVSALRQADGVHVQVLLMVRDDFWMGISRLFETLEISLDPERNTRAVDLFDLQHARRVLYLFGETLGRFSPAIDRREASESDLNADQRNFLDQSVHELSEDGRVISVRLSLFADLMKERPWTLASLLEVGGAAGVAVRFLEETFSARSAVPERRAIEKPARALLHALLPEAGTDIKGHMRSRGELASACALAENSNRFARLMQILDHELHLITPTEAESRDEGRETSEAAFDRTLNLQLSTLSSCYQLTHDYLVAPLWQWLTLERRKSWRGRAELSLENRTAQMTKWPQSPYLPTPLEFLAITFGVPPGRRKPQERTLMSEATRHYALRWGSIAAVLVAVAMGFSYYRARMDLERVQNHVDTLLHQSPNHVEVSIIQLAQSRSRAVPVLRRHYAAAGADSRARLHAAFALAKLDKLREAERDFLLDAIPNLSPDECPNLVAALEPQTDQAREELLTRATDRRVRSVARVRYATTLLLLRDPGPAQRLLQIAADPTDRTNLIHDFAEWHGDLAVLPESIRNTDDGHFRSGLCSALGLMNSGALGQSEREALAKTLTDIYRNAVDGASHSAAGWTLRQWKFELPFIPSSDGPRDGRQWFVTKNGLTFVKVPKGEFVMPNPAGKGADCRVSFTRGFFISASEIPIKLFIEFLDDPTFPQNEKPDGWRREDWGKLAGSAEDYPAQWISWQDAVLFCNWLSDKEGLTRCYFRTGLTEKVISRSSGGIDCDIWRYEAGNNGYRLPVEPEWEYACRAGVATDFVHGRDEILLEKYAVYNKLSPDPCASRLPNGFGCFDMLGNVFEWCWNPFNEEYGVEIIDPWSEQCTGRRAYRGGGFRSPSELSRINQRFQEWPIDRFPGSGFRVVRNLAPPASF